MSSYNRKYSRSRSPGRYRSNKHKRNDNDNDNDERRERHVRRRERSASPGPARSKERYHIERRERDRYGDSDHRRSVKDSSSRRGNESYSSHDRRDNGYLNTERAQTSKELNIKGGSEGNFGRLKEPAPSSTLIKAQEDVSDENRKRKAEELNGKDSSASASHVRRSRFDKSASNDPAIDPKGSSETIAVKNDNAQGLPQAAMAPSPRANESGKVDALPIEDEKSRLLRERQEKLAQWKRKKAEEAAKKGAQKDDPTRSTSSKSTSSLLPEASSAVMPKPKLGIAKFGTTSKSLATAVPVKSRPILNFMEDQEQGEDHRQRARERLGAIENATSAETVEHPNPIARESSSSTHLDDEDVDPLDAFMAENTTEMAKSSTAGSRAGEVMNKRDSEEEDYNNAVVDEDILAMVARKTAAKKKELSAIDHSAQDYEPFRKDFYVEPAELSELTDAEVDAMRFELDGILIRGKECPKPMTNWGQCGLSAASLDQIQRLGYTTPTSIQAQAIPAIMSGRDTIGVAKTGSGKTMAFLLPMFRHIKDQRPLEAMEGPIAIILTPTRELAIQIHKECKPFLKALDLRAVSVYGGGSFQEQIAEIKRGAEIVVCTPGRMIDILAANQGRVTNLRRVTYTVLDEADRMFDLGFEPQVMKILNNIRPQRQTVLFSATFPKSMEALARKVLRGRPVEITVGARSVVAPEIEQRIEVRPRDPDPQKFNRVLEILGELYNRDEDARTLIFVDRQEGADSLLSQLMRKGYPCNALHGGKDQSDRASTISDFKAGIFPILVATSVAARGLDVKQLKLVVNYDCPNHMEDYVHRVGRTGRAGNKGVAITFVSEDQERYAFDIAKALRLSQVQVPEALKVLAESFAAKVKSGQEKGSVSGFGGKGLAKFDTMRDQEKRTQRRLYGEEEGVVDGETSRKTEPETDDEPEEENDRVNPEEVRAIAESGTSASADAPIKVERVTSQMKATAAAKPNVGTRALNAMEAARARADALNNRIKTGTKTLEQVASNPDAGEYRAMMEINDYPQKARWNVTNRTNIAKVLEATGTSITTQGQYVKPGSSAPAGVPKLYLLVEGPTELCVTDAVKELRRLLSEGALSDAEAASGRYQVV